MNYIGHKISRAKWFDKPGWDNSQVQADAITSDLRTQSNRMSFWRCDDATVEQIDNIALALASISERIDSVDITWVDLEVLKHKSVDYEDSPGKTPIEELRDLHLDLVDVDLKRLGIVACEVKIATTSDRCKRYTKTRVKGLVVAAIRDGRLSIEDLHIKIQDEIRSAL